MSRPARESTQSNRAATVARTEDRAYWLRRPWRGTLTEPGPDRRAEGGDQKALLFIIQIAFGVMVWVLIERLVGHRFLGQSLGFFGMWVATFPFARRTWAARVPVWRYWAAAATGTAVAAGLQALLQ
jgi:hypothetical protein